MGIELQQLVSVVIPTYNRADVVSRSVESVLAQDWRPIELIVVNDGSDDHTRDVLVRLERTAGDRGVTPAFIHQENRGRGAARNRGLEQATGEYVALLDDDDTWTPDKLTRQLAELQATGAGACCCYVAREKATGEKRVPGAGKTLIRGRKPGDYIRGNSYAHLISLVVRRNIIQKAGTMDESLRMSQDTEWIGRLVHYAEFCAVEETLARNTFSPDGVSRVQGGQDLLARDEHMERVLDKWRKRLGTLESWDEEAWQLRVADAYEQFIKHQLYAGNLSRARQLYDKGVSLAGPRRPLVKARKKMRRACWLKLFGKRIKHPKFSSFEDIRM